VFDRFEIDGEDPLAGTTYQHKAGVTLIGERFRHKRLNDHTRGLLSSVGYNRGQTTEAAAPQFAFTK
jgi:hypothetical protein